MPTTPAIDANAQPLFSIQFEALLEGLDGNGVDAAGDLTVTDGSGDNESDIATGTAHYDGSTATLGSTSTVTHSDGDGSNDRWDIIVFDVGTGSVTLREGTAAADPVPPDLQADEVLLALVYVASSQTDFGSDDIVNWRVPAGTMAVADSGTDVLTDAVDIDFAAGIQASDGGTSTATVRTDPGNALENTGEEIGVASDSIQTDELDLSISPSWTGVHDYSGGGLSLPTGSSPSPTTDGRAKWDTDDDNLVIGDGSSSVTLVNESRTLTGGAGIRSIGDLSSDRTVALASSGVTDTELGVDPFVYAPGMTEWATGLSDEEINRIKLQSGETLVVERIEFRQKGGGSSSNASIDVRDVGASTTIGSQTLGGTTKDAGSSTAGNTVIVRISNSTGSAIEAAPRVQGYITGV